MDLARRLAQFVGTTSVQEILGGHQSRVFEVAGMGQRMVVKVQDASMLDRRALETRVETIAELARIDAQVCRPLPINGRLVAELDGDDTWVGLVTCSEYAAGQAPDVAIPDDAVLIGRSLARLHQSLRSLGRVALPLVAALDTAQPDWDGPTQLLHGDFNAGNLRHDDGGVRIFDFDDCGYGPPSFDVANALYMVLFDDLTAGQGSVYRSFSDAFLTGYRDVGEEALDPVDVNGFIDLRVAALQSWLGEPATAPIGIRKSAPAWHTTLRAFISQYRSQRH